MRQNEYLLSIIYAPGIFPYRNPWEWFESNTPKLQKINITQHLYHEVFRNFSSGESGSLSYFFRLIWSHLDYFHLVPLVPLTLDTSKDWNTLWHFQSFLWNLHFSISIENLCQLLHITYCLLNLCLNPLTYEPNIR